jgi:hypothetical protein
MPEELRKTTAPAIRITNLTMQGSPKYKKKVSHHGMMMNKLKLVVSQ